jgi:hypothetical protein
METLPNSADRNSNPSISSAGATPASHLATPESGPGLPTLGIFGQSSPDCFAYLDPDTHCWKTSQANFLSDLETFSETWPNSGTMRNGRACALQTLAPATCESGCLLWPTPDCGQGESPNLRPSRIATGRTTEYLGRTVAMLPATWPTATKGDGESGQTRPNPNRQGGAEHESLRIAASCWPTARADCLGTRKPGTGGKILAEEARNWPTARQEDGESCGNHPGATDSLTGATAKWATPAVPNGGRTSNTSNYREDGSKQQVDLGAQVSLWQTPATDSFRSRGGDRKDEQGLDQQARFWPTISVNEIPRLKRDTITDRVSDWDASLPAPQIPDGPASCETSLGLRPPSKRRLSPVFVEFLMGFPLFWTEL